MKIISGYTYDEGSPEDHLLLKINSALQEKEDRKRSIEDYNATHNYRVHHNLSEIEKCEKEIKEFFEALKKLDPDAEIKK